MPGWPSMCGRRHLWSCHMARVARTVAPSCDQCKKHSDQACRSWQRVDVHTRQMFLSVTSSDLWSKLTQCWTIKSVTSSKRVETIFGMIETCREVVATFQFFRITTIPQKDYSHCWKHVIEPLVNSWGLNSQCQPLGALAPTNSAKQFLGR